MKKQERASDSKLGNWAERILSTEDEYQQFLMACRAVRDEKGSNAMDRVWRGDRKAGEGAEAIECTQPGFKEELGRIGASIVEAFDHRAVLPCYMAFCKAFMNPFEELKSLDGGSWMIGKELSWQQFVRAVFDLPRNKAVGAGGFSIEMLLHADQEVLQAFFDAMHEDLASGELSSNWKRVIYTLLVKPLPNDPELVSQRRDIALMAVDMKLCMLMIRRTAYARLARRILGCQSGWVSGVGAVDPGLTLEMTIQQARRLRRRLYILYTDLATFFPACNRSVVKAAELLHGLPKSVTELVARIFGEHGELDDAMRCQYESAAGLGAPFQNYMGALMGCVCSPDKAKLLLNTVLVAIAQVARGVRAWGFTAGQSDACWAEVMSLGYADDWAGCFESVRHLRAAWICWQLWTAAAGCKLGIKMRTAVHDTTQLKTVVTGVDFASGAPATVADPGLPLEGGGTVPWIKFDEVYKHLGSRRAAGGDASLGWKGLRKKFTHAISRLARMRKPTINTFMMVSDALLGGLAGYFLQSNYITRVQAEEVEAKWRGVFNSKFGRTRSTVRAELYESVTAGACGKKTWARRHLWGLGLASVYTSVGKAMADVEYTAQNVAARSTVALSMAKWGCRQDPNTWDFGHLIDELEVALAARPVKYLGDAYLLAAAVCEREQGRDVEQHERGYCEDRRAYLSARRQQTHGRWARASELREGDPLRADAAHFRPPTSAMLFEPVERGGVGAPPRWQLLDAGVCAIGHMCGPALRASGAAGRWLTWEAAVRATPALAGTRGAAQAWQATVEWLCAEGLEPVRPERVGHDVWGEGQADGRPGPKIDVEAATQLLQEVRADRGVAAVSEAAWHERMQAAFPGVSPREATESEVGVRRPERQAAGARVFNVLGKKRTVEAVGGEAQWLRARGESGEVVGVDGYFEGWEARAATMGACVDFDAEGYAVWAATGVQLSEEEVAALPMMPRAVCKARAELGDVPVFADGGKRKETHVNLATLRANWAEACTWQARLLPNAVYATDGTRTTELNTEGIPVRDGPWVAKVVARAFVRADMSGEGGRVYSDVGHDNYLAELVALLDVLTDAPASSRVVVVLDATSPVRAWLRFREMHDRIKLQYYGNDMLDTLDQLVERHECVLFLWQTSHVGSPFNEMADVRTTAAAEGSGVREIPRLPSRHYGLAPVAPTKGLLRWAREYTAKYVSRWLRSHVVETQMFQQWDLEIGASVHEGRELAARQVRGQRCCMGDARRFECVATQAEAAQMGCPHGCRDALGKRAVASWSHAVFRCQECSVVERRRVLRDEVSSLLGTMTAPVQGSKQGQMHDQLETVSAALYAGLPESGRFVSGEVEVPRAEEVRLRRFVGGLVAGSGREELDKSKGVLKAARGAVDSAVLMVVEFKAKSAQAEDELRRRAAARGVWRKWSKTVRQRVAWGGPGRAAALAWLAEARERAYDVCVQVQADADGGEGDAYVCDDEAAGASMRARMERVTSGLRELSAAVRERHPMGTKANAAWANAAWRLAAAVRRWMRMHVRTQSARLPWCARRVDADVLELTGVECAARWPWLREDLPMGEMTVRSAAGRCRDAMRWWARCGGAKALRKAFKEMVRAKRRQEIVRMAESMRTWAARGTISGAPAEAVEKVWPSLGPGKHRLDLVVPRAKRQAQARASRRESDMRGVRAGHEADSAGRWAIAELLEVDRCEANGRKIGGRGLRVHVRWRGAWETGWQGIGSLTADMKLEARRLEAQKYGARAGRDARPQVEGRRRSERQAARAADARTTIEATDDDEEVEALDTVSDESETASEDEVAVTLGDGQFEVDEVLGVRGRGARLEAHVRWKATAEHPSSEEWILQSLLNGAALAAARKLERAEAARRRRQRGENDKPPRRERAAEEQAEAQARAAAAEERLQVERGKRETRARGRAAKRDSGE